jgi:Branched-chain amino acid transport system / permease component
LAQGLCGFAGGHWDLFFAQLINGLSLGGVYALIALGYTVVYGIAELINFADGDVYTLGRFSRSRHLGCSACRGNCTALPSSPRGSLRSSRLSGCAASWVSFFRVVSSKCSRSDAR